MHDRAESVRGTGAGDESDNYPDESGRRRFVEGVVGSASLVGTGTAAAADGNPTIAPSGAGGGIVQYFRSCNDANVRVGTAVRIGPFRRRIRNLNTSGEVIERTYQVAEAAKKIL